MRFKLLGSIFLLAFIVRLIFVAQWHATAYGPMPLIDGVTYHAWAQDIASGHLSHGRAFYIMPLYPYLLGLFYVIFGHSLWVASILNAAFDAGTCVLLADIGFAAFGLEAAVITGLLAAFYRPFIFYTPPVMKESLGLFLLALFVSVVYRAHKSGNIKTYAWSGVCLSLCGLVRGNALALGALVLLSSFHKERFGGCKKAAVFLAGMMVIILPVTIHNAVTSHDFVLTSYADGLNAYIGNGPSATGTTYSFPHDLTSNPESEEFNVVRVASEASGRPLRPSEVDHYWWHKTIEYVRAHPTHEMELLLNKLEAFWSNDEPYDNYDMDFLARHFGTIIAWPMVDFGIVTAMSLFTVIACPNKKREEIVFFGAMIILYMLTLVPFYVTDRYRLPVVIFLLPLAGAAVTAGRNLYREKDKRRLAVAALAASLPLSFMLWPRTVDPDSETFNWGTLCQTYEEEGYHIASIIALNQALLIEPHNVAAAAWIKSADALDHLGHHKEAEEALKKIEPLYPTDGTVPYNIGRMAFIDEDYPTALEAFKKAIALSPTFALAYRGLAAVYDHYGDRAKALETIRQGLKAVPGNPKLLEVIDGFR